MSTRAHITVTDSFGEALHFYRHSDGYPERTLPILETFLEHVKKGRIRDNASQASGWLVVFGHREYLADARDIVKRLGPEARRVTTRRNPTLSTMGWKVGAFEPTTPQIAFGVEYVYMIDLDKKEITVQTGREARREASAC